MIKIILTLSLLVLAKCSPFTHIGCYSDPENNQLYKQEYEDLTPEVCYEHCDILGTSYILLSEGNTCSCCNHVGDELLWMDGCSIPCAGQSDVTCGGLNEFDIFEISSPDPPLNEKEYIDCFVDCKEDRIMEYFVVMEDLTPEVCRNHCLGVPGSLFYATQFSNECFCGKSSIFQEYDRHGRGNCHMACSGDETISCGGYDSFDLFKFDECDSESSDSNEEPETEPETETEAPVETEAPDSSETSVETEAPDSSETSVETEAPDSSETSVETESPDSSETSVETEAPKSPETSVETEAPKSPEETEEETEEPETSVEIEAPVETDSPVETEAPVKKELDNTLTEFERDILESHNAARCKHGADPLTYSEKVAKSAQSYADKLASTNCGKLKHSTSQERFGYGENLYLCGGSNSGCYTSDKAMQGWYIEEINDVPVTTWQGHATQILWKSSKELGCGIAQCDSLYTYEVLVCQFNPAGNYMARVVEQVGVMQAC